MPYLTQKAKGVRCRWGGGAKYGGATDHHRRATERLKKLKRGQGFWFATNAEGEKPKTIL
jgi:hypothetical protein